MPDTAQPTVDVATLRAEVQAKYREVAHDPTGDYHFHTGRAHARRLGYPPSPLNQLPEVACEAFAGVANPFHWDHPQPGDQVVDLGSGAGMRTFLAALLLGAHRPCRRGRGDPRDAGPEPPAGRPARPRQRRVPP